MQSKNIFYSRLLYTTSLPPCHVQTQKTIILCLSPSFSCYLPVSINRFSKTEDRGACSPNGFASRSRIARFLWAAVLARGCAAAVAAAQ